MPTSCTDEKLKAAVIAFSTPVDQRLAVALEQAFSQPGITSAQNHKICGKIQIVDSWQTEVSLLFFSPPTYQGKNNT